MKRSEVMIAEFTQSNSNEKQETKENWKLKGYLLLLLYKMV